MAKRTRIGGRLVARGLSEWREALRGTHGLHGTWAFEIDSGNPDVQMLWDNTIKYSSASL